MRRLLWVTDVSIAFMCAGCADVEVGNKHLESGGEEPAGVVASLDCLSPETCPGSVPVLGTPVPGTGESPKPDLPLADEVPCNGADEDGDGLDFCLGDADGDGTPADFDCDDLDPSVDPKAEEIRCDGKDQNCDGLDDCDADEDGVLDRFDCDKLDPTVTTECQGPPPPPQPLL